MFQNFTKFSDEFGFLYLQDYWIGNGHDFRCIQYSSWFLPLFYQFAIFPGHFVFVVFNAFAVASSGRQLSTIVTQLSNGRLPAMYSNEQNKPQCLKIISKMSDWRKIRAKIRLEFRYCTFFVYTILNFPHFWRTTLSWEKAQESQNSVNEKMDNIRFLTYSLLLRLWSSD